MIIVQLFNIIYTSTRACPPAADGSDSADRKYAFADAHSGFPVRADLRLAVWHGNGLRPAAPAFGHIRNAAYVPDRNQHGF